MAKVLNSKNSKIAIEFGDAASFVHIGGVTAIGGIDSGTTPTKDVSDLDSVKREKLGGLADAGSINLSLNLILADLGQQALEAAYDSGELAKFEITAPGVKWAFEGLVTTNPKSMSLDTHWTHTATIEISGDNVKTLS